MPFVNRTEVINVAGADPVTYVVRETIFGPCMEEAWGIEGLASVLGLPLTPAVEADLSPL